MFIMVVDLVSHFIRPYFDHVCQLNGLNDKRLFLPYVETMTTLSIVST